jgi:hypothetical protein
LSNFSPALAPAQCDGPTVAQHHTAIYIARFRKNHSPLKSQLTMPAPQTPPSYPSARRGYAGDGISPRKVILGLILAASIVVFFLILFVGVIAIVQEGSLRGARHLASLATLKHAVAHLIRLIHR